MADELPDFHIPHAEKIEWMIETNGWAIEAVPARTDVDPPFPGYTYSIGFPERFGFAEVVVVGLKPSDSRGMLDLVAGVCQANPEIPLGVPVLGVFDHDLRCMFAPIDLAVWSELFPTAIAWHRTQDVPMVQMLWPDPQGVLPHEDGFDPRLAATELVIGTVDPS